MSFKMFKIVENKRKFFLLSIVIIAIGFISMGINASAGKGILNFDIDFTGGTALTIDMGKDVNNDDIAEIVEEVTGQTSPQIQKIIGSTEVSLKIQNIDAETRVILIDELTEKFELTEDSFLEVVDISATVSNEMQQSSFISVGIACAVMLVYIAIRFGDLKMGFSAIIALVHDVLVMICVYAVLRIPVNTAFIASLLTVLGYSINSTIVIFDRIRENRKKENENLDEIVDVSVWQTMRRSVYTSLTTLFTIGALYIFGVQSVKEFALPIMVGVISGIYSSIFISGPLWDMMVKKFGEANDEDYYEQENTEIFEDPFKYNRPDDYE